MNHLLILRINLIFVSLTGLLAGVALVMPWKSALAAFALLGINDFPETIGTPYLEYIVYMSAGLSVIIGALFLMAGIAPRRYANIIPFLGWSLLFIGVIVTYHGFRLELPPWPFYPDPIISFVCGVAILFLARKSAIN